MTCTHCETRHYRNPKPCANVIVVDDGRVLLVRRASAPWAGRWCGPGGFCERGEHPIETAERETYEETGWRVEAAEYLGTWVDEYADAPSGEDAEIINVAYYLATPGGAAVGDVDPDEVADVRWFAWDDLPAELAPPGTLDAVLEVARARLEGRPTSALPDRPQRG